MKNHAQPHPKSKSITSHKGKAPALLNTAIQAILISLFIYAAASKLLDYQQARHQMLNQVLAKEIALALVWLLPATEIIICMLILFKKTKLLGLYAYLITMIAFTIYIALVMAGIFGRIPCSCGGAIDTLGWKAHLALNLTFIILAITSLKLTKQEQKAGPDRH